MKTTDVKIWAIRQKTDRKKPSWEVRWKTAHKRHATVRRTKALAETFWSDLKQAAKNGEEFDIETGLPGSMAKPEPEPEPEKPRTFLMLALQVVRGLERDRGFVVGGAAAGVDDDPAVG